MKRNAMIVILQASVLSALALSKAFGADTTVQGQSTFSGADLLMKSVGATAENSFSGAELGSEVSAYKLNEPFLLTFFGEWKAERQLPYDVNLWANSLLKGEFEKASHVWSAVEGQIPESFRSAAEGAQIYSFWKLGLSQLFIDQWIRKLSDKSFTDSKSAFMLNQVIQAQLPQWLLDQAIAFRPDQLSTIEALPTNSPAYLALKAWAAIRGGEKAVTILPLLPNNHPLKLPLAQSAALAFARKGDLGSAARILKTHAEASIEARKELSLLPGHQIQIARLLFQAGALSEAEQYYSRVPSSAPEFFKAHEELTWVLLRKGDQAKLRGVLKTLNASLFEDRFQPESYVVRAISDLKLCDYSAVEAEFKDFQRVYGSQAKKIDEMAAKDDPEAPRSIDAQSSLAQKRVSLREAELAAVEELHRRSIAAALPAVGFQSQWIKAKEALSAQLEAAKKTRSLEYRRQWRNQKALLGEAIQKMQFVRLELMNQIREANRLADAKARGAESVDSIRVSSSAPARDNLQAAPTGPTANDNAMVFPVDSTFWPDEFFHLRSVTKGRCLR